MGKSQRRWGQSRSPNAFYPKCPCAIAIEGDRPGACCCPNMTEQLPPFTLGHVPDAWEVLQAPDLPATQYRSQGE